MTNTRQPFGVHEGRCLARAERSLIFRLAPIRKLVLQEILVSAGRDLSFI